jgi:flagellar basal body-associated protein FliL
LDVPNKELRAKAEQAMPLLRDAYVRSLLTFTASTVRSWRQPDVGEIADRLQHVTDRTLGRTGARLLLAQVAMRLTK